MALVLLLAGPGPVPTNIEEGARDRAETPIDYYERLQYVQYEAFPIRERTVGTARADGLHSCQ
jgi:hypothetical protein